METDWRKFKHSHTQKLLLTSKGVQMHMSVWIDKALAVHLDWKKYGAPKGFSTPTQSQSFYMEQTLWTRTKSTTRKVQSFINCRLRRILKICWPYTVSNTHSGVKPNRCQQWTTCGADDGNLLRKISHNITRHWDGIIQERGKWGRPQNIWRRDLQADS